jgi:alpha-beta hydrolase superfamily lysophospholipase
MTTESGPLRKLLRRLLRLVRLVVIVLLAIVATIILVRAFDSRRMQELEAWHRQAPPSELRARDRSRITWSEYLDLEERVFAEVDLILEAAIDPEQPDPFNRFVKDSQSDPNRFERNWNRSFELVPDEIRGGALLLHGLSDSPYSLLKAGRILQEAGYYVLAPRMPGHGTLPAGLVSVQWEDWMMAVDAASRHVREKAGDGKYIVVGYSNGGTLAVLHALDRYEAGQGMPDKVMLLSPAIGVTPFARFATWHKSLSFMPYFEQFRWQSIEPEFDPFKYNSFPKNAGHQSHRITTTLQRRLARIHEERGLAGLPPFVAFQSLVDTTVVGADLVHHLFDRIDDDGSELVIFDINRTAGVKRFLRGTGHDRLLDELRSETLTYRMTLLTNVDESSVDVVIRTREPGAPYGPDQPLDLSWPRQVYSLSHVALPFPADDPIYGDGSGRQDPNAISIGTLEPRGERNMLRVPYASLLRLRYNPFFPYMEQRFRAAVP